MRKKGGGNSGRDHGVVFGLKVVAFSWRLIYSIDIWIPEISQERFGDHS